VIFETLHESAERGELMLVDGGMCHWHFRRDGQLTIREIISTRRGAGRRMLRRLYAIPKATSLFAKCPADLPSNEWYSRRGFVLEATGPTNSGRALNHWRLPIVRRWSPNVGNREIIYCADGNRRFAEIAIDAGLLYGARLPATIYYRPYFVDQDWKKPDRIEYMAALKEYRPWMATVLDWEREDQLPEVLDWAKEAAEFVAMVVIIPKVIGGIIRLPRSIGGKPIRLGYSVPTAYGGTKVPTQEFRGWPVHLLGGNPSKQLELTLFMNVQSTDTNFHHKQAIEGARSWIPNGIIRSQNKTWPTLEEFGGGYDSDAPYEAFRRSCEVIRAQWGLLHARNNGKQQVLPFTARVANIASDLL
jgi:hypothetical protein